MKVLKGVLKEEAERQGQVIRSYKAQIAKLPKGSLQKKQLKGSDYYYLAYRKGEKVLYRYLGRPSQDDLNKLKAQIAQRRHYEKLLREARANLKKLRKLIHGKRNAI